MAFFADTVERSLKLCVIVSLLVDLSLHGRFDDLALFQGNRRVKIINCKLFLIFLSTVV